MMAVPWTEQSGVRHAFMAAFLLRAQIKLVSQEDREPNALEPID